MKVTSQREKSAKTERHKLCLLRLQQRSRSPSNVIGLSGFSPSPQGRPPVIFASAYALSTAESLPRSGVLRRAEDAYGLESIDCCCATLKSGALFMASG